MHSFWDDEAERAFRWFVKLKPRMPWPTGVWRVPMRSAFVPK
jgi:hypothetical protein